VTVAANGARAIDEYRKARPDIILMDLQMPEVGGIDATTRIRALERDSGGRVPIIALTAHAMEGDRERCLAAGMDGYVSKPIHREELFALMARLAPTPSAVGEGGD
jgi:CheY-like chemotaxis protein